MNITTPGQVLVTSDRWDMGHCVNPSSCNSFIGYENKKLVKDHKVKDMLRTMLDNLATVQHSNYDTAHDVILCNQVVF